MLRIEQVVNTHSKRFEIFITKPGNSNRHTIQPFGNFPFHFHKKIYIRPLAAGSSICKPAQQRGDSHIAV